MMNTRRGTILYIFQTMIYVLDEHGTCVQFLVRAREFLFSRTPGPVVRLIQPPIQRAPGAK
jgi:hypothetical protein